jgi:hypothetical protein
MKKVILLFTAIFLASIFVPFGFLFGIINSIINKELGKYLLNCAITIDKSCNVSCEYLLNSTVIKSDGYKFGNSKETISSVLGKDLEAKKLTYFGRFVNWGLNKIQKAHSIISVDYKV